MNSHISTARYAIRVEHRLGPPAAALFPELECSPEADSTLMTGTLPDQSALHGILTRIRDLGLVLISVTRMDNPEEPFETRIGT